MSHKPNADHELLSAQVLLRFLLRIVLLGMVATFGTQGFGRTFEVMLALAAFYCVVIAAVRREAVFGPVLTHYDEAAIYALCARMASWTV